MTRILDSQMRRRLWLAVLGVACMATAGCPSACDQINKIVNPTGTSVQSVTVAPASAQLIVGQTQQFTGTVLPTGAPDRTVTWSVTPSDFATIDANGLLTAKAAGQAVVTATSVGTPVHTAQAAVTISAPTAGNAYFIRATFISVLNGPNYLGDPQSVQVCSDPTCATPIANATVTMNSGPMNYDPLKQRYTGNFSLGLGASYSLKISGGGTDYTASGTQFTTFPNLLTPASGSTWSGGLPNNMSWTAGAPTANASNFLGIVDGSGKIFYPAGNKPLELPISSTSFTIPAGWTSIPGDYYIYNGIGTPGIGNGSGAGQTITNAAPGSGLYVGGITTIGLIHVF